MKILIRMHMTGDVTKVLRYVQKGPFTLCPGCDIEISNPRSHLLSLSTVKFCFKSKEILFIERMITIQGGYLIFCT